MSQYDKFIDEIYTIEKNSIEHQMKTVDRTVMEQIINLLLGIKEKGRKVITAGCGTSGIAAQKIAHTLSVVEVPSFFLSPANSIHGGMGAIQSGDVVVLLTKGGNTPEIINYIPVCKEKGATIIGVTADENSILGKNCDILLKTTVEKEACPWNLIASASIISVLSIWDAIALTIMQFNGLTKEEFYLIHSGGSAGEKLLGIKKD